MQRKTQKERRLVAWGRRTGSKKGAVSTEINLQHCRETQSCVIFSAAVGLCAAFTQLHTHRYVYLCAWRPWLEVKEKTKSSLATIAFIFVLFLEGVGGGVLTGYFPLLLKGLSFVSFSADRSRFCHSGAHTLSHTAAPQLPEGCVCAAIVAQPPYKAPGQHKSSGTAPVTQIFPFGQLDIFDAVSKGDKNQGCVGWLETCQLAAGSSVSRFTAVPQWWLGAVD